MANYELIVSMAGGWMPTAVLNLSEVKHASSEVTSQLDFRFLNEAWPEFDFTLPRQPPRRWCG